MRKSLFTGCLAVALFLTFGGCGKSSGTANQSSSPSTSAPSNSGSGSDSSSPPGASNLQPAPAPPVVVPSGTSLAISLEDTIDTKVANDGDHFAATLAEPISVAGNVVLPVGTRVSGTIITSHSAGKFNGNAVLALTLDTIRLNGNPYSIQTSEFEDAAKGRGKRTGIGAGGGAAFGAIVGALAGGGKGAAIGALAGGGAGTAGAAFTGKRDITLPAETRLHFRLTQPVTIQQ
jgi:hypothetical protein